MPHHKSAKKRVRQTVRKTANNTSKTSMVKTIVKKTRLAIANKDKEGATALLSQAQSLLARLAKVGVIKNNTAARRSSRLAQQVNKI